MEHICEIWVRDKRGRIRAYRKIKKALVLRNFGTGFAGWFKLLAVQYHDPTEYPCTDIGGVTGTFGGGAGPSSQYVYHNKELSGIGSLVWYDTGGRLWVCAGNPPSPTTASIDNYALDAEFGSAYCGPVAYAEDLATGKMRIAVTGSIGITADTSVSEVGLRVSGRTTDGINRTFLICRDIPPTPISVSAGQTLTIKYTWIFN